MFPKENDQDTQKAIQNNEYRQGNKLRLLCMRNIEEVTY